MVPTLTWGLLRSNCALAIRSGGVVGFGYVCGLKMNYSDGLGACNRDRTGDLVLTKDVLYQLSYAGLRPLREIGDSQLRLIFIPLHRLSEGVKARVEPAFFVGQAVFDSSFTFLVFPKSGARN